MSDEEFREFHLDGKHLAFLVMSGIGVAVVVFLCGVLVGRGVRAPRSAAATDLAAVTLDDGPIGLESSLDDSSTGADGGPRVPGREPSRSDRSSASLPFTTVPTPDSEPVAPRPAERPAPRAASPASAAPAAKPAPPPPVTVPPGTAGGQWVVQVASGASRPSAETVAGRLKAQGYQAFISENPQGAHQYRVRIGMFGKKSDADAVAARLKKEGKSKDLWVTNTR
jgi:cell division septation protein DedD